MQVATPQGTKAPLPKSFPGFAAARDAVSWPDRRRGQSNFLTWAFLLSEIWAANLFFGGDANASEALSDPSQHGDQPAAPEYDPSFGIDWTSSDPKLDLGDSDKAGHSGASSSLSPQVGGGVSASPLPGGGGGGGASGANAQAAGGSGSASALAASTQHLSDSSGSEASSDGDSGAPSDGADLPSSLDPGLPGGAGSDLNPGGITVGGLVPGVTGGGSTLDPGNIDVDVSIDVDGLVPGLDSGLGDGGSILVPIDDLLSDLDPGLAGEIGLELSPLDLDADLQIDLLSGPLVDADLSVQALGLDLSVETTLLSGLGLESDLAEVGGSLEQLIDGATGLNVGGTVESVTSLVGTTQVELSEIGGAATEIVTGLPVDDVLSDSVSTIVGVVPDTALLSPLNEVGALPAGDAIVFPNATGPVTAAPDTLFNGAQYTDYNVALQTDVVSGGVELGATDAGNTDLLSVELASGEGPGGSQGSELTTGDVLADVSNAEHDLLKGLSL